jgi:DNA-binding MarR family transcriptional regulator
MPGSPVVAKSGVGLASRDGATTETDSSAAPGADGDVRWLTPAEQRAWRALQYLRTPLGSALNRQLTRDSNLSTADYEVLVVLSESADGLLRAGELGQRTGWEKSRLSHHIKRMVARGLVERRDCVTDGRGLMVSITGAGRQAIRDAAPGHVRAVREYVIDLLTPEQVRVLAEIGEAVGARITVANCAAAIVDDDAAAESSG